MRGERRGFSCSPVINHLNLQTSESKKRLALAIIDFLSSCVTDGTVSADDSESISVATQIIADSFAVNPDDKTALADALGGQSLFTIYGVFEKMRSRAGTSGAGAGKAPVTPPAAVPTSPPPAAATATVPTPEQKAEAESLKAQGNAAMAKKDYPTAIDLYSKALVLTPGNPIFLSNRAAAYSASFQHKLAVVDAQAAVEADPSYSKAWSRLGLAKFALGDSKGAVQAYEKGIDVESSGGKTASEAMLRGYETAKRRLAEGQAENESVSLPTQSPGGSELPDLSGLGGMFGGSGGGGGMPNLGGLLSNPMVAQMAQNFMKNPEMMNNFMKNPMLKQMMDGVSGGDLPDMSKLMSDPTIANM